MNGWIEVIVRQVGHLPKTCRICDDKVTLEQFFLSPSNLHLFPPWNVVWRLLHICIVFIQ